MHVVAGTVAAVGLSAHIIPVTTTHVSATRLQVYPSNRLKVRTASYVNIVVQAVGLEYLKKIRHRQLDLQSCIYNIF